MPWLRLSDDRGRHDGLGNPLAGVKWRFYDAGENEWQVSVYPQIEFNLPGSRSDVRGLGDHGPSVMVPFQAKKDFGALSLNADAGFVAHRERGDEWFGDCAVGRKMKPNFEIVGELHWNVNARFREPVVVANLGARIGLSERYTLLVSAGRELRNGQAPRATFIAYFGLQARL